MGVIWEECGVGVIWEECGVGVIWEECEVGVVSGGLVARAWSSLPSSQRSFL